MKERSIDKVTMLVPFSIVIALMVVFIIVPEKSKSVVDLMRGFLGDTIGHYYPIVAIGSVVCALYVALEPKYGSIKLGNIDKPGLQQFQMGNYDFHQYNGSRHHVLFTH